MTKQECEKLIQKIVDEVNSMTPEELIKRFEEISSHFEDESNLVKLNEVYDSTEGRRWRPVEIVGDLDDYEWPGYYHCEPESGPIPYVFNRVDKYGHSKYGDDLIISEKDKKKYREQRFLEEYYEDFERDCQ